MPMTNAIKNQSKRFARSMSVLRRAKRSSPPTAISVFDRVASERAITFSLNETSRLTLAGYD